MLVLDDTTTIKAHLSGTGTFPFYAVWADLTATGLDVGAPAYGTLSGTSDVTVVAAPAASTIRTVKYVSIVNDTANARTATVMVADGVGTTQITAVTLSQQERLEYEDGCGWRVFTAEGILKQGLSAVAPTLNQINSVVLASDQVNNNAVANTLEDVTGLSFPVTAGETYWFEFVVPYTAAATTTGSRWTLNGPALTLLSGRSEYTLTATTTTLNSFTAYAIPAACNATSLTAGNVATLWGIITPSASGTVQLQHASEVAGSAITAKAGALLRWMRVL